LLGVLIIGPITKQFIIYTVVLGIFTLGLIAKPVFAMTGETIFIRHDPKVMPEGRFEIWGKPTDGILPDPSVHYGRLPNGLRYAILPNGVGKSRVAFQLRIIGGHLAERQGEQGAAHLLEHMAFRGSKAIPEGQLRLIAAQFGMLMGKDVNAITGWGQTDYTFVSTDNRPETASTFLNILRHIAGELLLEEPSLDKERRVVLNEIQLRLEQDQRWIRFANAVAPGSPLASFVLGDGRDVENISAGSLRRFYHHSYRPENAVLVIVGDVDVSTIEAEIVRLFGNWRGVGYGGSADWSGFNPRSYTPITFDIDAGRPESISLAVTTPFIARPVDRKLYRRSVLEGILNSAITSRISRAALTGAPIIGGSGGISDVERSHRMMLLSVKPKPGAWKEALAYAETERRRLIKTGLTKADFEAAKSELAQFMDQRDAGTGERDNAEIAQSIAQSAISGDPLTTDAYTRKLVMEALEDISLREVNSYLRKNWRAGPVRTRVELAAAIPEGDPVSAISAVLASVGKNQPEAALYPSAVFAHPPLKAGKIVRDGRAPDGIRRIVFENGVRFNLKRTSFEKGSAQMAVSIGNGAEDLIRNHCLFTLAPAMLRYGGTKRQSAADLQNALQRYSIKLPTFFVTPNRFVSNVKTTAGSIELQARVAAAYVAEPGFRSEAADLAKLELPDIIAQRLSSPDAMFLGEGIAYAQYDDQRGKPVDASCLAGVDLREVTEIMDPILQKGAIEIGVVGDIADGIVIDAIAKSFGALPTRARTFLPSWSVSIPVRNNGPPKLLKHSGNPNLELAGFVWKTDDDHDPNKSAIRTLLASILAEKLFKTAREDTGATYNPVAFAYSSPYYKNLGYIVAYSTSANGNLQMLESITRDVITRLANGEVDEETLSRIRLVAINQWKQWLETNSGWIEAVGSAQSSPDTVERLGSRIAALNRVSAADIQSEAKNVLAVDPVNIRIVPKN
jgi:zinc protease